MNTHRSLMVWPITEQGLTMTPDYPDPDDGGEAVDPATGEIK